MSGVCVVAWSLREPFLPLRLEENEMFIHLPFFSSDL